MAKNLGRSLNPPGHGYEQPGVESTQQARRQRSRWAVRAAIAGTGALALLGVAGPAAADVSVTPTEAAQGDAANLTLLITNESRTASITAIDVQLPADTPIAEVYPLSVADWAPAMTNVKIDKPIESLHGYQITDVTTAVKWVAMPGKALPPGGKTELPLSIGPLPSVANLSFGVVLTNSDGTQVRFTGRPGTSAAPGEQPAPVLALKAAPGGQGAHAAGHGSATAEPASTPAAAADTGSSAAKGGTSYGGWTLTTLLAVAAITVFGLVFQRRRAAAGDPPGPERTKKKPNQPAPDPQAPVKEKSMAAARSRPAL